jgi:hypothetical protein
MTDYSKHIETMERAERYLLVTLGRTMPGEREALTAAIELMRASQPKDEEAERAECERLAEQFMHGGESTFDFEEEFEEAREILAGRFCSSRAAARAEGYASGRSEAKAEWADKVWEQNENARTELAAAKASISALEDAHFAECRAHTSAETTLKAELAAARAEIERLRNAVSCEVFMYGQACDRLTETETKLNNLRDVTERLVESVEHIVGTAVVAEAILAIEASR